VEGSLHLREDRLDFEVRVVPVVDLRVYRVAVAVLSVIHGDWAGQDGVECGERPGVKDIAKYSDARGRGRGRGRERGRGRAEAEKHGIAVTDSRLSLTLSLRLLNEGWLTRGAHHARGDFGEDTIAVVGDDAVGAAGRVVESRRRAGGGAPLPAALAARERAARRYALPPAHALDAGDAVGAHVLCNGRVKGQAAFESPVLPRVNVRC